jgi:hypothetical protein
LDGFAGASHSLPGEAAGKENTGKWQFLKNAQNYSENIIPSGK